MLKKHKFFKSRKSKEVIFVRKLFVIRYIIFSVNVLLQLLVLVFKM
jgi:hypothetical protein